MTEEEIRQKLADAQEAFSEGTRRLRLERQQAVMEARAVGWSKYKIAAAMGVKGPTVDAIIATAADNAASD